MVGGREPISPILPDRRRAGDMKPNGRSLSNSNSSADHRLAVNRGQFGLRALDPINADLLTVAPLIMLRLIEQLPQFPADTIP